MTPSSTSPGLARARQVRRGRKAAGIMGRDAIAVAGRARRVAVNSRDNGLMLAQITILVRNSGVRPGVPRGTLGSGKHICCRLFRGFSISEGDDNVLQSDACDIDAVRAWVEPAVHLRAQPKLTLGGLMLHIEHPRATDTDGEALILWDRCGQAHRQHQSALLLVRWTV